MFFGRRLNAHFLKHCHAGIQNCGVNRCILCEIIHTLTSSFGRSNTFLQSQTQLVEFTVCFEFTIRIKTGLSLTEQSDITQQNIPCGNLRLRAFLFHWKPVDDSDEVAGGKQLSYKRNTCWCNQSFV